MKALVLVCVMVSVTFGLSGCTWDEGTNPTAAPSASSPSVVLPAGSGRLLVDTADLGHVSFVPLLDVGVGDPDESDQRDLVLPAGEYAVSVYLANTSMYVANVAVKDQETTVVTPVAKP
jgi:hypothetical protein